MQDLTGKGLGDSLTHTEWNQLPQEIQNIIVDLGITLSSGDLDQAGKAIAAMVAAADFYTAAGTDTITLTKVGSKQAPPAYLTGMRVRFRPANANTGAVTINVNAIGAKSLKREGGAALIAGNLNTTIDAEARYDGTDFLLMESTVANAVITLPRGYIDGLIMSNGTVPDTTVDIAAGQARNDLNDDNIVLGSALGKLIDTVATTGGTPGSPTGGFPDGLTLTADTWYHVFVISDGTLETGGFDISTTASNLIADHGGGGGADLSGYTSYRRIGSVLVDGTSDILLFWQHGNRFVFDVHIHDVNLASPGTSEIIHTLSLPTGIKFGALVVVKQTHSTTCLLIYAGGDVDLSGRTPGSTDLNLSVGSNSQTASHDVELLTNISAQIKTKQTIAAANLDIFLEGWTDLRGQNS